jgi:hypothetical protein
VSGLRERVITRQRPLPLPSVDNREFYEAAQRGELRFQRCSDCGTWRHYPRPICAVCLSRRYAWERASGRGELYSWTVIHGPTLPAFQAELPYVVGDVLLEEGIHFQARIHCAPGALRAGLPLEAIFVPASEDVTLVEFRARA